MKQIHLNTFHIFSYYVPDSRLVLLVHNYIIHPIMAPWRKRSRTCCFGAVDAGRAGDLIEILILITWVMASWKSWAKLTWLNTRHHEFWWILMNLVDPLLSEPYPNGRQILRIRSLWRGNTDLAILIVKTCWNSWNMLKLADFSPNWNMLKHVEIVSNASYSQRARMALLWRTRGILSPH